MSRTSTFSIEGVEYTVFHNGDWSGPARIVGRWPDGTVAPVPYVEATLPGKLLCAIGREAAVREVLGVVEGLLSPAKSAAAWSPYTSRWQRAATAATSLAMFEDWIEHPTPQVDGVESPIVLPCACKIVVCDAHNEILQRVK